MNDDLIGEGFEYWWAQEGHERYKLYQAMLGYELPLKQLARDAWHNAQRVLIELASEPAVESRLPIFTNVGPLTEFPDLDTVPGALDNGVDVWSRNGNI